jgi:hypothetical protein
MKARRLVFGLVLAGGLAAAGLAQETSVSFTAGGFFAGEGAYREIYGTSVPLSLELWWKSKGPFGLSAGFGWLEDDGLAIARGEGDEEYPVEFRMTSIPLVAFYEVDLKSVRVRVGAGVGIHSYEEAWPTSALVFAGEKVGPRFIVSTFVGLSGRFSLVGTFVYENISTGAGSLLSSNVNLGGYQFLFGVSYRVF